MKFLQKIRAASFARAYQSFLSLRNRQPQITILDIGIGNGVIASHLRALFSVNIIGTDILDYVSADIQKIPFVKMKTEDRVPFPDKSFTYAMLNDVLHHVPKKKANFFDQRRSTNF